MRQSGRQGGEHGRDVAEHRRGVGRRQVGDALRVADEIQQPTRCDVLVALARVSACWFVEHTGSVLARSTGRDRLKWVRTHLVAEPGDRRAIAAALVWPRRDGWIIGRTGRSNALVWPSAVAPNILRDATREELDGTESGQEPKQIASRSRIRRLHPWVGCRRTTWARSSHARTRSAIQRHERDGSSGRASTVSGVIGRDPGRPGRASP